MVSYAERKRFSRHQGAPRRDSRAVRLGIDFGTTRTVVAVSDRGNYPVVSFMDGYGDPHEWFPSVVAERDGELRFGFEALDRALEPGWTLVRSFKRRLGGPGTMPETRVRIGSSEHAVGDVLVGFLEAVARALRTAANVELGPDEPLEAVMATPAHALGPQRFVTIDAFERAGFQLLGFLDEPSAAGFEYTHRFARTLNARREHVLVYDLGGGTFDAALVHLRALHHEVVTTGGDPYLGGDDFDAALGSLVLETLGLDPEELDIDLLAGLADRAREAKEALNPNSRRVVVDLADLDLGEGEVSLPAQAFYDACLPIVERTIEAMRPVLGEAGDRPLAGLYVVGGGSALPVVGRRLKALLGHRVHRSPYPSAAVAIGLAVAADETAGFEVTGRLSRVFGVFRELEAGQDVAFDPIFGREAPIPGPGETRPQICREYRAAHNLGRYRFVETSTLDQRGLPHERLKAVGEVSFPFDPRLREPGLDLARVEVERRSYGPLVREEYSVSPLGLVEVALTDLETGYARRFTLGQTA